MKPTRVAIIVPEGLSGRGGIGRVMRYLVRYLAAGRPDIAVAVYRSRLTDNRLLKHPSVPFALANFALACVLGRVDVAHINVAPRGSTWRKALFERVARAFGVPVVLHLHGSGYDQFYAGLDARRQTRLRALFHAATRVVVLSDYWRQFAIDQLMLPPAQIVEIANGVPAAPPPLDKQQGGPVRLAFLGIVGPRKGIDVLLDALASPAMAALDWTLTVGGNGAVEEAAEQAKALGIADRVTFLGWVEEDVTDRVLRNADIFVLPSRAENQPVSILEAMARATPVVATRIGAIPAQVVDGVTGMLVDPEDAEGLAGALASLVGDAERRRAMGEAGLARFTAQFSVEAYGERFADLYRGVAR